MLARVAASAPVTRGGISRDQELIESKRNADDEVRSHHWRSRPGSRRGRTDGLAGGIQGTTRLSRRFGRADTGASADALPPRAPAARTEDFDQDHVLRVRKARDLAVLLRRNRVSTCARRERMQPAFTGRRCLSSGVALTAAFDLTGLVMLAACLGGRGRRCAGAGRRLGRCRGSPPRR
jgi:hypothetical protein